MDYVELSPSTHTINSTIDEHSKTSFEKNCFSAMGEYAEYGFDQQG